MSGAAEAEKSGDALADLGGALAEAGAASLAGQREKLAEGLLRAAFVQWENPEVRPRLLEVLRSATNSAEGAAYLREFLTTQLFAHVGKALNEAPMDINQVAKTLDVPAVNINAAAGQVWGVVLLRYVVEMEPIASTPADDLIELLAPTIQRYLAGQAV